MASEPPAAETSVLPTRVRCAGHGLAAAASGLLIHASHRSLAARTSWVGLLLFYPAFCAFLGNVWCLVTRRPVAFRSYRDERFAKSNSDWSSTLGLGSFALFAGLALLVPETQYFADL